MLSSVTNYSGTLVLSVLSPPSFHSHHLSLTLFSLAQPVTRNEVQLCLFLCVRTFATCVFVCVGVAGRVLRLSPGPCHSQRIRLMIGDGQGPLTGPGRRGQPAPCLDDPFTSRQLLAACVPLTESTGL